MRGDQKGYEWSGLWVWTLLAAAIIVFVLFTVSTNGDADCDNRPSTTTGCEQLR